MFGSAGEVLRNQFTFKTAQMNLSNKENVKNRHLFTYILDKCLYNPIKGEEYQDVSLLHDLFTVYANNSSKYKNLQKINANIFLSDKQKTDYMKLFSRSQKIYLALSRLAFIWKYKKAVRGNSMDMMMNDIHRGEHGVVEVYQEGSIFLFRTQEINRIVENSICETEYMFASPKSVKNPFNNLPFTKANLYTMYFKIDKMRITKLPIIFYKYFLTGFNLTEFYKQNHALIRDKGIQDYLKNSDNDELYDDVFDMLDYVQTYSRRWTSFNISDDCCKDTIVKIMKPYLKLYFIHRHSLNKYEVSQSFYELRYKLFQLLEHNPRFGRKIRVRMNTGLENTVKFKTIFSLEHPTNHIPFDRDKYNHSHLTGSFIDDDDYYRRYDPFEDIPIQPLGPGISTAMLHTHTRFNVDESVQSSSDSDDETDVSTYAVPLNSSSDIEGGEIVEGGENNEDESVDVDYILDYAGDVSSNMVVQEIDDTSEDDVSNTLCELCIQLEMRLNEIPDEITDEIPDNT